MVHSKRVTGGSRRGAVIFDFDGTIADSFEYVFDFLRAEAKNTHKFTAVEKQRLRQMSMKRLALHLGVAPWKLVNVYFKGRRVMRAHMEDVQPFPGMVGVIRQLHADGLELYVASANSGKNIRHLLQQYDLLKEVRAVRGGSGFTGKTALLKQLQVRYHLSKNSTWYVGDETADVVAAARAGLRSLAVGWGFADPAKLRDVGPDAFAEHPEDIPNLLSAS